MPTPPDPAGFLPLDRLSVLIGALQARGYRVLGAAPDDGALGWRELSAHESLPRGLAADQSPGRYHLGNDPQNRYFAWVNGPQTLKPLTFAPRETLWRATRDTNGKLGFEAVLPEVPKTAVIGARACDLAALALQDAHFLDPARQDAHYAARRANLFLVAVQCAVPAATCFCASTGDGPTPARGYDLSLAELAEGFVVSPGSEAGRAVFDELVLRPANDAQLAAIAEQAAAAVAAQTRSLPGRNLADALTARLEHPQWDNVAARCLACGNCTAVCPTCFCHAEVDTPSLDAAASEHERHWDSCFGQSHGYLHGFNVRSDTRSRYRQWLTHKLAFWHEQYGRSGCVGCGRCIAWCPAGIDLTAEVTALTKGDRA